VRLDRLTVSTRRVVAAGAAALAVLILLASINTARPASRSVAAVSGGPSPGGDPDWPEAPGPPPAGDGVGPGSVAPVEVDTTDIPLEDGTAVAAEEALAHQVAADFAAGYAGHHFDDPPSATAERVRPFVTTELAAELARNSGATAAQQERAARQERATAAAQAVQHQGGSVAEGRIDVLVVVRQDVTWSGGSEIRWPTYVLQVARVGGQWRVAHVLP